MMKRKLLICCIIICYANTAMGFDDQITHPKITEKGVRDISGLGAYLRTVLGYRDGVETRFPSDSHDTRSSVVELLKKGSTDEDSVPNICRASNHFHDPLKIWSESYVTDYPLLNTACNYPPFTTRYSNITWATGYLAPPPDGTKQVFENASLEDPPAPNNWDNARAYYYESLTNASDVVRETNLAKTFQAVGQVMHLLQDMAAPAHVRSDFIKSHVWSMFATPTIHS